MTQMKKYINHIKLISKENSQEEWDNLGDPIQKFDIQYLINILKIILLFIRQVKIKLPLSAPSMSLQHPECTNVARRIRPKRTGKNNDCLKEYK